MCQLTKLERIFYGFLIAVDCRRYLYLTGGVFTLFKNESSDMASMLDILTLKETALPALNHARRSHSSLILNRHLFVVGGYFSVG